MTPDPVREKLKSDAGILLREFWNWLIRAEPRTKRSAVHTKIWRS